jgi:hypothetical protein
MGGTTPVHALLTALFCTAILIPMLRLALAPHGAEALSHRAPALAGGMSILLATAALLPMGGDGMMVPFADPQLAFALLFAVGLLVLGSTHLYRELHPGIRLAVQLLLAVLAALGGLSSVGAGPARFALTLGVLLVGMNSLQSLRSVTALPAACAAAAAGFFALMARVFSEPGIAELNLGLCGGLATLLLFDLTVGRRLRADLGSGGQLAIGFLLATTALRLVSTAIPEARPWLVLPCALPLLGLLVQFLAAGVRFALRGRIGATLAARRFSLGLSQQQKLILGSLASAIASLGALRLLGLIA